MAKIQKVDGDMSIFARALFTGYNRRDAVLRVYDGKKVRKRTAKVIETYERINNAIDYAMIAAVPWSDVLRESIKQDLIHRRGSNKSKAPCGRNQMYEAKQRAVYYLLKRLNYIE